MHKRIHLFLFFIPLVLFCLQLFPGIVAADGYKRRDSGDKRYENGKEHFDNRDRTGRRLEKEDEGNEVTGQTAAWLLVAANFTAVLSILLKGVTRHISFEPETKSAIKKFDRLQKRHLLRFHYILNPVALCIAAVHFLLSSCRRSPLPEWGLFCVALMVLLGFAVKFRLAPRRIQRFVYRLHTGAAPISIIIVLLLTGHMIVD